nr:hypothetical protein BaRGS_007582 [Batillaria attramentaria]
MVSPQLGSKGPTLSEAGSKLSSATPFGSLNTSKIELTFEADCEDEGVYSCCEEIAGADLDCTGSKSLQVEVFADKVELAPVNLFDSVLVLRCLAKIGRGKNVSFAWQYKDKEDDFQDYTGKRTETMKRKPDSNFQCQDKQDSLMAPGQVREGRLYRCYVNISGAEKPVYSNVYYKEVERAEEKEEQQKQEQEPEQERQEMKASEKTLSYEVLPGAVELSAKLPGQNLQGDNTVVLSCVGKVGHNSSLIKWIWQYKEPAQDHFRDLEDNAKVAADQSAEDSSFPCQQEQRISLTLKASEELEGRTYRCFIRKSGLPEKPLQYGQYRFPGIDITFLPGKPRLSEFKTTMRFRINCSRDLPNLESLEIIRGDSNLSNSDKVVVASAAGTNLLNYGIVNFPEARHSGGVKSGWITMDFKASCPTHEGMYACCASWTDNNLKSRQSKCLQKQLEFDLPFGEVTLTPSPSGRTHGLNSILVLRCAAKIGRSDENVTWVWQYKDATDGGYRDFAATSRISTKSSARTPGFECQWRQNSVLTLRVTQADLTGRAYRCFVRRNGLPVEPTQAGVYTFPKIVKNGQPKSGSVDEDVKGGSEDSGSGSGDTKGNGGVDGDPDADDSGGGRDDGVLTVGTSQKGRAAAVEGKD